MLKKILISLISCSLFFASICLGDLDPSLQVKLPQIENYISPSERFNKSNAKNNIDAVLNKYGATKNHKAMFQQMIDNETSGFFGYHAGCSDYRIFQDVIKIAIEEYLEIPIRHDFQFLRVPGIVDYSFESADAFVAAYPKYNDNLAEIKKHILSINIALYNSWNAEWDFTPRYFLQNQPWTLVLFEKEMTPFFKRIGLDQKFIKEIFQLARKHVPQNKGIILQFFDSSHEEGLEPYAFLDEQAYVGNSGSKIPNTTPSHYYINAEGKEFPQLRLVMNNVHTLNPNSPLVILRYHTMTQEKEETYERELREFMRALPFDHKRVDEFRKDLLEYWNYEPAEATSCEMQQAA